MVKVNILDLTAEKQWQIGYVTNQIIQRAPSHKEAWWENKGVNPACVI